MKNTLLFVSMLWIATGHSQSIFELPKQPTAAFMKSYGDNEPVLWIRTGDSQSIFEPKHPIRTGDSQSIFEPKHWPKRRGNVLIGSDSGRSLPPHTKTVSGSNNYVLDQGPTSDAVKKGLILVEDTDREYPNAFYGKNAPMKTVSVSPSINTENVFIGKDVFIYGDRNIVICNKAKNWMNNLEVDYLFYVDFDCDFLSDKPELKQALWDAQSLPKVERWKVAYNAVRKNFNSQ